MLIDHIGYFILPQLTILRLIGRLTFPIFAFLISEGTKYTKNKLRYLLTVGILGVVWQIYLIIFRSDYHFNVLITFSISIVIIYAMDYFKKCLFDKNCKVIFKSFCYDFIEAYKIFCVIFVNQAPSVGRKIQKEARV